MNAVPVFPIYVSICPACGALDATPLGAVVTQEYFYCHACGAAFSRAMPSVRIRLSDGRDYLMQFPFDSTRDDMLRHLPETLRASATLEYLTPKRAAAFVTGSGEFSDIWPD